MKRIALISLIFLLFVSGKSLASHIVGGEFELIHVSGSTYQLNLIIYFDDVTGNPGAEDPSALPFIFRKRDNAFMDSVRLQNMGSTYVSYSNPACATGELVTRKIIYSADITLSPEEYNDPEGYYIVWERCCRNNTIDNVVLFSPDTVGQSFYLEFPAVNIDGAPFNNSSPVLFPPLSDYACIGQHYFADFAGTDVDGDSLVYSLATPLNSSSIVALPVPTPNQPDLESRPLVPWIDGIDVNNMVPGAPPLRISNNGFITVTPSMAGLFVFAVKVEEYRHGRKIGEVRRDFQMLVLDCPPLGVKPELTIKVPGDDFFDSRVDTLKFSRSDEKCFEFFVTDQDGGEEIKLDAVPVNFSANISDILIIKEGSINDADDTLKLEVCLPDCPLKETEPFIIDFIATDNSCPLPLSDTLRLVIAVESPENVSPEIASTDPAFAVFGDFIETIQYAGNQFKLNLEARDSDGDMMSMYMIPVELDVADFALGFTTISSEPGRIVSVLEWDLICEDFDFTDTTDSNEFTFRFLVEDMNECNAGSADTLTLKLNVKDVPNTHDTFLPPNAFSPNNDGINDYFELCDGDKSCDPSFILPYDNCSFQFVGVNVYNRWGKLVYQEEDRNFRWNGEGAPPGTYFYHLKYTNGLEYKGTINIIH